MASFSLRLVARWSSEFIVIAFAAITYVSGLISPPHLMDDVDAAESLQAKNMLISGDWVTQHLNGTAYLDKAPLKYWITASLFKLFGVHDWVARLPTALAAILLCWLVVRIGRWAESPATGLYAGLVLATSIGLFLFTRTVIPDVILVLFITLSLWCLLRLLESERPSVGWALGMYGAMGGAVLTKGMIGVFFPVAVGLVYLVVTKQLKDIGRRLFPVRGLFLFLLIAAPWHVLASIHNPPVFDFTLHPGAHFGGQFRGFFWFYFINEQLLRFLNERWPRDYNTVPRLYFWLYHIVWFFPWSFFLPAAFRLSFRPVDRASRMRMLAICWIGVILIFFTFSTTQEYYSMPIYPAIALLLGSILSNTGESLIATRVAVSTVCLLTGFLALVVVIKVWSLPAPGDIYAALSFHPELYTLSLGHMADLTWRAFAYLRLPLLLAGIALCAGGLSCLRLSGKRAYFALALMMAALFQAARLALVVFDPYLSSYAVAQQLNQLPEGQIVVGTKYNPLSSVFFYSRDSALQIGADLDILEYGSLAPGAPRISLADIELKRLWDGKSRIYVMTKVPGMSHLKDVLEVQPSKIIFRSGDKLLLSNRAAGEP